MKVVKVVLVLMLLCLNHQFSFSQEISRENKKLIKTQEEDIRANEEMLISGLQGLSKIKERLEKDKLKKRISKEEITRKEKIIRSVSSRLKNLETKIATQKKELASFKKSLSIEVKEEVDNVAVNDNAALIEREAQLKLAKEKLAKQIKENEEAYAKQMEALKKRNEELAKLDSKIKAEKEAIKDKLAQENRLKIMELEDDISVNEEILNSGKEGLQRKREQLEKAKQEGSLSEEAISRRVSVIQRIEKRLNKIEREIETKKEAIKKLKGI